MAKLLVVDDNQQNRYLAQVLLSSQGHQVELAANGAEALQKARKAPPDLIVADILMPVMDGFALCREWIKDEHLHSIPFIFYTATYTEPEDEKFGLSLGAARYLVKPSAPEQLADAIAEVLAQSRATESVLPDNPVPEEEVYLKKYNQTLIHKLEDKLLQLEAANKALEAEIQERKLAEERMCQLEKQLLQSQKMEAIGTLAGGIAHDFNNILLAVMGYSEMALINAREGQPTEPHLSEVIKACQRAKELVNQILTFSRQTDMEHQPVQVQSIVKEALKLMRPSLPATIRIKPNLKSNALISANPTQLYQVVMNLCTNAAHAMKEKGGDLDVEITETVLDESSEHWQHGMLAGTYLALKVADCGVGIPPEQLNRIFEPYFTTKQKGEGTGLGLSVVHGIIKDMGGAIHVESQVGRGTTFQVFFPIIESRAVVDEATVEPLKMGRGRILFIDDEAPLIEIGTGLLEKLGYDVTACSEAASALQWFKEHADQVDLVISDMTMPGMTGELLARELLKIRPDLPVILSTGFSSRITEAKAQQMGIKAILMKPYVMRDLSRTIRQAMVSDR